MKNLKQTIAQMTIVDDTMTRLGLSGRFVGDEICLKIADLAAMIVKLQTEKK